MTTTTMKKATKKTEAKSGERLKKQAIKEIGERIASMEGAPAPEAETSAQSATTGARAAPAATTATKGKKGAKAKATKATTPEKAPKEEKRAKPSKVAKPRRISALDAAATVLRGAKAPMNSEALIVEMANRKLWASPNGATPSQTLYAALGREIASKGKQSRFTKIARGLFAANLKMT